MSEQPAVRAAHKWLSDKHLNREINVQFHCHGWRVTLKEDYHEVGYGVKGTLEESLEEAFSLESTVRESVMRREIERQEDYIRREASELSRRRKELRELKKKYPKAASKRGAKKVYST